MSSENLVSMAAPLAVGAGAAALSGPAAPIIGPLAGMGTYGLQQFGQFMQRQAQEGATGETLAPGKAATAAAVGTTTGAVAALDAVKAAIVTLSSDRAQIGANLTRLNMTNEQLAVQKTNLASANSRIKDVDVAQESTEYARYNILVQSGTAMLAQANQQPQAALRLLG